MWWLVTTALAGTTMWAAGDVVNLRARPESTAEVVLRLRIGTRIDVETEQAGWVHVSLAGRPDAHRVEGWIHADLAAANPPDAATLMAEAAVASSEERAVLEGRARALDPWHPDVVDRFGQPEAPTHLAVCDGERAWLIGTLGTAGFAPLAVPSKEEWPTQEEVAAYATSLATAAWYVEGWLVAGGFPTPFLVPDAAISENGGDGWAAGVLDGGDARQIVVGACSEHAVGQVFATAPLAAVAATPAGPERLRAAIGATSSPTLSGVVATSPDGTDGAEVLTFSETARRSCGGEEGTMTGTFWSWLAPDGTPSEPFLANDTGSVRPGTGLAAWRRARGHTFGTVLGSDGMTQVASVIVLDGSGGAAVEHVVLRSFGC